MRGLLCLFLFVAAATATDVSVNFGGTFLVSNVSVTLGSSVVFVSKSTNSTVMSAPLGLLCDGALFQSPPLANGASFAIRFLQPGVFFYKDANAAVPKTAAVVVTAAAACPPGTSSANLCVPNGHPADVSACVLNNGDPLACEKDPLCLADYGSGRCYPNCRNLVSASSCKAQLGCTWFVANGFCCFVYISRFPLLALTFSLGAWLGCSVPWITVAWW